MFSVTDQKEFDRLSRVGGRGVPRRRRMRKKKIKAIYFACKLMDKCVAGHKERQ